MTEDLIVRRSPIPAERCNLARSFELIGERWALLILRSALYGVRRFADFQADLDIPRSVLSSRLAALTQAGIFQRSEYRETGQRSRAEYLLTDMGKALALPFMAMTAWGDLWLGGGKSPLTLRSRHNHKRVKVAFVDADGTIMKPGDMELDFSGEE